MVGLTASDQAPLGKSAIVWFAAWHRDNPAPVLGGAVTSPQRPPRTFPGNAGPTVLRTDVLFLFSVLKVDSSCLTAQPIMLVKCNISSGNRPIEPCCVPLGTGRLLHGQASSALEVSRQVVGRTLNSSLWQHWHGTRRRASRHTYHATRIPTRAGRSASGSVIAYLTAHRAPEASARLALMSPPRDKQRGSSARNSGVNARGNQPG